MSDITKPDQSLLLEFEAPEVDRDQFPVLAQTGVQNYLDYIYEGQWNLVFTAISKWSKYLDKYHSVEFWVKSTGSDSNTGTDASPFLTIDHAIAQVAEGGNAKIHIEKNVVLTENITIKGGLIAIIPDASETFTFGTHSGAGTDDDTVYHLTLEGDASFVSFAEVIVQDTDYDTNQSCIIQAGYGAVQLLGGITFDDNSGVTNPPALVNAGLTNSMGRINLFTSSTITTNASGYIVGEAGVHIGGSVTDLNGGTTIDDPDYWWENFDLYEHTMTGSATTNTDDFKLFGATVNDPTIAYNSEILSDTSSVETFYDDTFYATVDCDSISLATNLGSYTLKGQGFPVRFEQWDPTLSNPSTYGYTTVVQLDKNITRNF